jgi:hypothetical protein
LNGEVFFRVAVGVPYGQVTFVAAEDQFVVGVTGADHYVGVGAYSGGAVGIGPEVECAFEGCRRGISGCANDRKKNRQTHELVTHTPPYRICD